MGNGIIVPIGDLHLPFLHKPTWEFNLKFISHLQPEYVVFMGDIYDKYSWNRFGIRINLNPKHEMDEAFEMYQEMIRAIQIKSPETKIYVIKGNHDQRGIRQLYERFGPSWTVLASPNDFWSISGANIIHDPKEILYINGIGFTHGHTKFGSHCPSMEYIRVVIGHLHIGDTRFFRKSNNELVWEHCTGLLGDPFHEALNYRPLKKYFNWHHGVSIIDKWGPRFIPLSIYV